MDRTPPCLGRVSLIVVHGTVGHYIENPWSVTVRAFATVTHGSPFTVRRVAPLQVNAPNLLHKTKRRGNSPENRLKITHHDRA